MAEAITEWINTVVEKDNAFTRVLSAVEARIGIRKQHQFIFLCALVFLLILFGPSNALDILKHVGVAVWLIVSYCLSFTWRYCSFVVGIAWTVVGFGLSIVGSLLSWVTSFLSFLLNLTGFGLSFFCFLGCSFYFGYETFKVRKDQEAWDKGDWFDHWAILMVIVFVEILVDLFLQRYISQSSILSWIPAFSLIKVGLLLWCCGFDKDYFSSVKDSLHKLLGPVREKLMKQKLD